MSSENKPFPIYQLQDAFEAFCNGEPLAKPQHRSLYYFLLGYCRRRGNTPRFGLAYEAGMHGSGIGSWATYDTALKALAGWGFIVYTPGANRYKIPVIELTFRNPTDDVLLTYWQSYCLSTTNPSANPTDDVLLTQVVTLKEVLKKEEEKVRKLESEKSHYQADVAAANAALAEAEKKIESLTQERDEWKESFERIDVKGEPVTISMHAGFLASHTEGGAADVGTRKARAKKAPAVIPDLTGPLADLLNVGGPYHRVQQLDSPLTQAEADRLVTDFGAEVAAGILLEMANYKKLLTNSTSANLTARKWLEKRSPAQLPAPVQQQQQPAFRQQQPTGQLHARAAAIAGANAKFDALANGQNPY